MPIVLKSGSLKLLEHSGPVQACNGIALPLPVLLKSFKLERVSGRTGPSLEGTLTGVVDSCSVLQQLISTVRNLLEFNIIKNIIAN